MSDYGDFPPETQESSTDESCSDDESSEEDQDYSRRNALALMSSLEEISKKPHFSNLNSSDVLPEDFLIVEFSKVSICM